MWLYLILSASHVGTCVRALQGEAAFWGSVHFGLPWQPRAIQELTCSGSLEVAPGIPRHGPVWALTFLATSLPPLPQRQPGLPQSGTAAQPLLGKQSSRDCRPDVRTIQPSSGHVRCGTGDTVTLSPSCYWPSPLGNCMGISETQPYFLPLP